MTLDGKWYVSVYDDKQTSSYDATEVEILGTGNWVRFRTGDGKIHVTSYPVNMRSNPAKLQEK